MGILWKVVNLVQTGVLWLPYFVLMKRHLSLPF
jgi:hypothetical protein